MFTYIDVSMFFKKKTSMYRYIEFFLAVILKNGFIPYNIINEYHK